MARLSAAAFLLAVSIGCSGSPTEPSALPLGEPFELRAGARAVLADDLIVIFSHVESDSRCPIDAICVRAGEAVVAVTLALRSNEPPPRSIVVVHIGSPAAPACNIVGTRTECFLSTVGGKSAATAIGYEIDLRQLAPYPRAGTPVQPGEYVATFVVSKE